MSMAQLIVVLSHGSSIIIGNKENIPVQVQSSKVNGETLNYKEVVHTDYFIQTVPNNHVIYIQVCNGPNMR